VKITRHVSGKAKVKKADAGLRQVGWGVDGAELIRHSTFHPVRVTMMRPLALRER
jgi:hypothetical protein